MKDPDEVLFVLFQQGDDHDPDSQEQSADTHALTRNIISRREFIQWAGTSALIVSPAAEFVSSSLAFAIPAPPELPPSPIRVRRVVDLLSLDFFCTNLQLIPAGVNTRLEILDPTQPAFIVIEFPPQHIVEEAFTAPPLRPALKRVSGKSRLAFKIANEVLPIRYSIEGLLGVCLDERNAVRLVPVALPLSTIVPAPVPAITRPEEMPLSTAIELPYRLILSPVGDVRWRHTVDASKVTHRVEEVDRTELWHTRLTTKSTPEVAEGTNHLRAIWSPDYKPSPAIPTPDPAPFTELIDAALVARRRKQLVERTADFNPTADHNKIKNSIERVIKSDRLVLSSLGAWLKARYEDDSANAELEQWLHETVMGRDQFVKVVGKGYLYPYGHRVSFVEIVERTIEPRRIDRPVELVAYLKSRKYIVIQEHEKVFTPESGPSRLADEGRGLPYKSVTITVDRTPDLSLGKVRGVDDLRLAFWPQLKGKDYLFPLRVVDQNGNVFLTEQRLVFVDIGILNNAVEIGKVQQDYSSPVSAQDPPRSIAQLNKQKVAFARGEMKAAGMNEQSVGTELETINIEFDAKVVPKDLNYPFLPQMKSSTVNVPAIKQLIGQATETLVTYNQTYLNAGFTELQNKGEVFFDVRNAVTMNLAQHVKNAGGLATPSMNIVALSRKIGPVGGMTNTLQNQVESVKTFVEGKFDPAQFFPDEAKLLGTIKLKDLMKVLPISDVKAVPQMISKVIYDAASQPTAVEARLYWKKTIDPAEVKNPLFVAKGDTTLEINAVMRTSLIGNRDKSQEITCTLTNFDLSLINPDPKFITVGFSNLVYTSRTGEKAHVDVKISSITLDEKLSFLKELGSILGPKGRLPDIALSGQNLIAKYHFPIPSIAVGAFALSNLSVLVGVKLPFDGSPVGLTFGISDRRNPFLVQVGVFGGGGYFSLTISPAGLEAFEAAIEFGGSVALDIAGIASGRVYLMAGISYSRFLGPKGWAVEVTGYLRCGGELRVLGILSISVVFYMGLRYEDLTQTFYGKASLTISIQIGFFSQSVELSIERRLNRGNAVAYDPRSPQLIASNGYFPIPPPVTPAKIRDLMGPTDWKEYTDAFA